jgi:hypothetical protein
MSHEIALCFVLLSPITTQVTQDTSSSVWIQMQEKHTLMFVASDINTVRDCHRLPMKATLNIDVFGLPLTNKYYSIEC